MRQQYNALIVRFVIVIVIILGIFAGHPKGHGATIDTFPVSGDAVFGGSNAFLNGGAAQSFVAPEGYLNDITFEMHQQDAGYAALDFFVKVTDVTGEETTAGGSTLRPGSTTYFTSAMQTLSGGSTADVTLTVSLGGIDLVDSQRYAIVLDPVIGDNEFGTKIYTAVGDAYSAGHLFGIGNNETDGRWIYYGKGDNWNADTNPYEHQDDMDLAFTMNFGTVPIPIPTTVLLLGSGLICLCGLRRRYKKQ